MPGPSLFSQDFEEVPDASGVAGGSFDRYALVAVERSIEHASLAHDDGLTYGVPYGMSAEPGRRVLVPLGRGKAAKNVGGYVVSVGGPELLGSLSPSRVRAIAKVEQSVLPLAVLELAKWIAGYTITPLGMVLATMVPAAVKHATGARKMDLVRPAPGFDSATLSAPRRKLLARIGEVPASAFPMAVPELATLVGVKTKAPIMKLIEAGALEVQTRETVRSAALPGAQAGATNLDTPPRLTDEQERVEGAIATALGSYSTHVIQGVTGSGKTEVYLRLIQRVLDAGRTAIVLVPEIALTPQTSQRFTRRFGPSVVAVLHSGLTAAQRHAQWKRCEDGSARVVVGARSCVFAPLAGLGLIVVDEEHDSSYKQDQLPRYHARDVAVKRAHLEGCPCVLASATPSLESWANTLERPGGAPGRFTRHTMTKRATGAAMPRVQIVDMAEERRVRTMTDAAEAGRQHLLGPTLEKCMERTLAAGGQVMLLLNRRGFAHRIACPSSTCGYILMCGSCDACLVHHKHGAVAGGLVRCHHCLTEQRIPSLCPTCGRKLTSLRTGTQSLEDEVGRKFASMGITLGQTMLRLDSDTMRHARDYDAALSRFASGEVRVLLGTQMIAKGLDFPNVRLVGVVDADTALALPDFRAEERTFQLVSQVAGRAGRAAEQGLTIVQTHSPRNPAITFAAAHDYVGFAQREWDIRVRAGLPPATRMARVVCRDKDSTKARKAADAIALALRTMPGVSVSAPCECTIARVADHWRWEVRVIAGDAGTLRAALTAVRRSGLLVSDAKTAVDVDPVAVM
ncbi:MAG TPA: primosomal protein N' [Phycisphaerales bacterium]|nr:primosomal protein N' [Phycisphaerales bacterium]